MKKVIIIFCLLVYPFSEILFGNNDKNVKRNKIFIRIVNESDFKLTKIHLFSEKFKDLVVQEKSEYKILDFDRNSDDAMIFLMANNNNFGLYLSPESVNGKYSYIIDSLSFEKRYIYLKIIKD